MLKMLFQDVDIDVISHSWAKDLIAELPQLTIFICVQS